MCFLGFELVGCFLEETDIVLEFFILNGISHGTSTESDHIGTGNFWCMGYITPVICVWVVCTGSVP